MSIINNNNATEPIVAVCPPNSPPPNVPPEFAVWSHEVPAWFWWTCAFMLAFSVLGFLSVLYTLHLLLKARRRRRLGQRVTGEDTQSTLRQLANRVVRDSVACLDTI